MVSIGSIQSPVTQSVITAEQPVVEKNTVSTETQVQAGVQQETVKSAAAQTEVDTPIANSNGTTTEEVSAQAVLAQVQNKA